MAALSYPKSVRLHHRKAFEALLTDGGTHYNAVFKVFWRAAEVPGANSALNAPRESVFEISGANSALNAPRESVFEISGAIPAQNAPGESRFAVSVPKKSFKRAVKRNLLKRRTREAIRLNRDKLPADCTADFLFFYRAATVLEYADIERAVIEAFTAIPAKAAAKNATSPETASSGDSTPNFSSLSPETATSGDSTPDSSSPSPETAQIVDEQ